MSKILLENESFTKIRFFPERFFNARLSELSESQVVTERQDTKEEKALQQCCNAVLFAFVIVEIESESFTKIRLSTKMKGWVSNAVLSELSKSQVGTERQAAREEKARIWFDARYLGNCKRTLRSHFWNKSCSKALFIRIVLCVSFLGCIVMTEKESPVMPNCSLPWN